MNPLFYLQNSGLTVGDETTNTTTEVAEEAVKSEGIIDVMLESWYIMGPLLVLSILAVYIFFERSMAISRALKEEKNLTALATIAGAAPMIGFLGTVIGMVQVFYNMQTKGVVEIDDLAGGMKFAMITTIAGLIVGIIAYVAYNSLVARVSKVINKMEAGSIEFLDILEEPGK
jgi:biopolymer transport protein ExbB/TolQ